MFITLPGTYAATEKIPCFSAPRRATLIISAITLFAGRSRYRSRQDAPDGCVDLCRLGESKEEGVCQGVADFDDGGQEPPRCWAAEMVNGELVIEQGIAAPAAGRAVSRLVRKRECGCVERR